MKYILFAILLLSTALPCFSQAANRINIDRGVRVELHEFSRRDGDLHIVYTVHMDARSIARYQGMSITPGVESDEVLLLLPSFVVLGPNKERVLTRHYRNRRLEMPDFDVEWKNDTTFLYRINVPFQPWMVGARLVVHQEVQGYRARSVFSRFTLSDRVDIGTPQEAHQVQPRVTMLVPEREEKILDRSGQAFLDFEVGRSVILPNFRRNPEELRRINETVNLVINNPDAQLKSIYIQGFASPEGSWEANDRLSRARANALKDYLRTQFGLPESVFTVTSVAEDWDGLAELVRESNLPQRDKILHIIATVGIFEGRETQLTNLDGGVPWRTMLRDMFPQLRRVEYRINYTVRDFGVQDATDLIDTQPEHLSHLEMFQVAETFGRGSDRYYTIMLETILRFFPNDEVANLNAAALLIKRGEIAAAKRHLERAGNCAAALNSRGVVALLEGDLGVAENYFIRAEAAGNPDATHNKGEIARLNRNNKSLGNRK